MGQSVRVALALSTIGRPTIAELLDSLAASTCLPVAVAIADHTPDQDLDVAGDYPFPVLVVPSTGGVASGRNHAVAAVAPRCDVLGFPNDDSTFPPTTLEQVVDVFSEEGAPAAIGGTLVEDAGPRFRLPPDGTVLDRRSVWKVIEPAMFIRCDAFEAVGGNREDLGTGAESPWQSGDGTDLLLRIMATGGIVQSRRSVMVQGRSERRDLSDDAWVAKHRAYARGTGYVYGAHAYPLHDRLRLLAAPLVKGLSHDPSPRVSLRVALARTVGRLEGLTGRRLRGSGEQTWL